MGQVLIGLLVVLAWAAPVLLAKLFADTLDRAPYLICLAIGVVGACIAGALLWPGLRATLANSGSSVRPWGMPALLAIAFCPTWAIGVGLGINRAFDTSAPLTHQCQVLDWQRPAKNRAHCLVTSWRGKPAEVLSDSLIQAADPAARDAGLDPTATRFPRAYTPGSSVAVTARAGKLGWEWIASVRRL